MKETVKVSIGGFAFTCDIDAYKLLDGYLDNLKSYFRNKSEGAEIINDIEGRMSELLMLKVSSRGYIVTLKDAQDIIEIMGKPSDIVDEGDVRNAPPIRKKELPTIGKKLYRDPDNAILGGVFSGLGYYFRIDPVILRVVSLLIIFFGWGIFDEFGGFIILAYFILWLVVPKAKTFEQKLAMSGKDSSVQNIASGNVTEGGMRGSGIGQVLKTIVKIFTGIILFSIALFFLLAAFSSFIVPSFFDMPSIKNILEVFGLYSTSSMIMLLAVWFIPAFMFIYFIVRLLMGFTLRDLAVLGIAFFVFICAGCYLGIQGVNYARDYRHKASYTEKFVPNMDSDTLRIELGKQYSSTKSLLDSKDLYVISDNPKSFFTVYPIRVEKDSAYKQVEVEIKKQVFAKNRQMAKDKAEKAQLDIRENDSKLILNPHLYNKDNIWDRELFFITIRCPEDKTIIFDELLKSRVTTITASRKKEIIKNIDSLSIEDKEVDGVDAVLDKDSIKESVRKEIINKILDM